MTEEAIPGYKTIRVLGKGGMAKVYLAVQEVLEREVALKVMSRALADDPTFGQRFLSEAKIVSQMVHPNIVTVYDMGVNDGTYYISMQFIDGADLKKARHDMSLVQKIAAVRDMAKALDYAAKKGIVHRDIKPENIMVSSSDGRSVLTDFGIAKATESDSGVTQTGMAIGTPHYMSPEQAKGKNVDPRSDIYSLGTVFYYLIVGKVPYDADSAVSIGIKHISDPVPVLPPGHEQLQFIVDGMMAKDRDDRFQSAARVIEALDSLDLPLLEHTVEIAAISGNVTPPPLSMSNEATVMSDVVISDNKYDQTRQVGVEDLKLQPKEIETEDHVFGRRRSILGWSFLIVLAMFFACGIIYYTQPEFAKHYIYTAEPYIIEIMGQLKAMLKSLGFDVDSFLSGLERQ